MTEPVRFMVLTGIIIAMDMNLVVRRNRYGENDDHQHDDGGGGNSDAHHDDDNDDKQDDDADDDHDDVDGDGVGERENT